MPWYTASLLFKSTHLTRPQTSPLWEERMLLIVADTEDEAKKKATSLGKNAEHQYEVLDGKAGEAPGKLKWTFEQIEKVYPIEDEQLLHGTELFSRFLRDSEVKSLLTPFDDE